MELVWPSMSFIFFTFDLSPSVAGCYFPQDGASLETIKCGSVREDADLPLFTSSIS